MKGDASFLPFRQVGSTFILLLRCPVPFNIHSIVPSRNEAEGRRKRLMNMLKRQQCSSGRY